MTPVKKVKSITGQGLSLLICRWLRYFLKSVYVGEEEESASGYFQLCPYSYLMVFIEAKG